MTQDLVRSLVLRWLSLLRQTSSGRHIEYSDDVLQRSQIIQLKMLSGLCNCAILLISVARRTVSNSFSKIERKKREQTGLMTTYCAHGVEKGNECGIG